MESKQKQQPFYFKVWNGTRLSEFGSKELTPIRARRLRLKRQSIAIYSQGITNDYHKEIQHEIESLKVKEEETRLRHQENLVWCVCFMASSKIGAEARLVRCVFKGVVNTEYQGYAEVTEGVYEANLNPERNPGLVDNFTRN